MQRCMTLSIAFLLSAAMAYAQSGSITVGGQQRTFIVYAPSGISNPPLVISMHGMGGSGSQQRSMSGFDRIAEREKFVVVYPDGINSRWDVSGNTDVNFILALIDTLSARHGIDRTRVYATGFSMGGMMSYKLACAAANKIAAIGPCSGYPLGGMAGSCSPSRPMPILHVHGSIDSVVPFTGLAAYVNGWISRNGCPQTAQVTKPYPESKPNSKVQKEYYGPCTQGSEIIVLTVAGMGHAYPGSFGSQDINASEEYWAFFKKYSLNGVGTVTTAQPRPLRQPIAAGYANGSIHINSNQGLRSVRVADIRGTTLHTWKAVGVPVPSVALPLVRNAGNLYLIEIRGTKEHTTFRVAVP